MAKAETKIHVRQKVKWSPRDAHEKAGIIHKPWHL